jgi:uncharacterized damage-inducible protein DinB
MFVEPKMVDVKSLLEYNESVRHRYFESLAGLSWKEFIKNREASFNSFRNIFIHTLEAIDYWLDFLKKENSHLPFGVYDEYKAFEEVESYMQHVEKRMHEYLGSLSNEGLRKTYTVTGEKHKATRITAEDILVHVFEEEVHHRGELIALLWQMGIDPPPMGWKGL